MLLVLLPPRLCHRQCLSLDADADCAVTVFYEYIILLALSRALVLIHSGRNDENIQIKMKSMRYERCDIT